MIFLAPIIRNIDLFKFYKEQRDENVRVLQVAEDERDMTNTELAMRMHIG